MSEQNLSQWFQLSEQTPWEVGVYQVEYAIGSIGHSYFDGKKFKNGWVIGSAQDQIKDAYDDRHIQETCKVVKWRGLSTNPEVKKKAQNKRKTMYVVIDRESQPVGVFEIKHNAFLCAKKNFWSIKTIRFRTPE